MWFSQLCSYSLLKITCALIWFCDSWPKTIKCTFFLHFVLLAFESVYPFLWGYKSHVKICFDSKEYEDLSSKAKSRFSISLRNLSQPMSLGEIAKTWDACARAVILEYAQRSGGGSFSSIYGTWEDCLSAAWSSFSISLWNSKNWVAVCRIIEAGAATVTEPPL